MYHQTLQFGVNSTVIDFTLSVIALFPATDDT